MSILGTGIDIVNNTRLKKILLKKNLKLRNKLFTKREISYCEKKRIKISCYAKRFSAKEAFVKALGTGFRKNINFKDIEIINNIYGQPLISVNKKKINMVRKILKVSNFNISLSISDDKEYSIANVIIFTDEDK